MGSIPITRSTTEGWLNLNSPRTPGKTLQTMEHGKPTPGKKARRRDKRAVQLFPIVEGDPAKQSAGRIKSKLQKWRNSNEEHEYGDCAGAAKDC
jgi:hypothetical protein